MVSLTRMTGGVWPGTEVGRVHTKNMANTEKRSALKTALPQYAAGQQVQSTLFWKYLTSEHGLRSSGSPQRMPQ